jgi:peroxiredoxin (alkyl hydroperoxide reductase subunit C)
MDFHQTGKEVYMPKEFKVGCARPTGGLVGEQEKTKAKQSQEIVRKEEQTMTLIGRNAPNFSAPAYHKGKFVNVELSEFLGKWVVLCFYPGDFTFV